MTQQEVLKRLHSLAHPASIEGKKRWNITAKNQLGITMPQLRSLAKTVGRNHDLALALWKTGIHEARILASMIDDPALVTEQQMDSWTADFDSWDVCDQTCGNLFDKTKYAYKKIAQYSADDREFVRRTAFTLIATLAVHDKEQCDARFISLLPLIKKYATDDRNFVKKAVNWALRQIGKRNATLNPIAIATARQLLKLDSSSARWIARDALRELESEAVKKRVMKG
ncbi:MAG TPA: DNA alkylation repair protein [Candidatus Peribacteraceae bacterium]|nr:DNA alkylation repair protein [Candidatus Peribacteraceae bacterium]